MGRGKRAGGGHVRVPCPQRSAAHLMVVGCPVAATSAYSDRESEYGAFEMTEVAGLQAEADERVEAEIQPGVPLKHQHTHTHRVASKRRQEASTLEQSPTVGLSAVRCLTNANGRFWHDDRAQMHRAR